MNNAENIKKEDWVVHPVYNHSDATRFVRCNHYAKGASCTSVYRHGLYTSEFLPMVADLHGVALWMPPTKNAAMSVAGDDWRNVLCLSRLCVSADVPRCGASFLLGRSMALVDRNRWPILLTYADTRLGHTGTIYKATNWIEIGRTAGAVNWISKDGVQMGAKRGPKNYTAQEMEGMGFVRQNKEAKIKFVHYAKGYNP